MRLFLLFASIPLILGKELIAEVRNIPDKCGLDDTIQYWINTASTARESTLQIIGGDFKLTNLEVTGMSTLGATTFSTVEFDQLIEREHSGEGPLVLSTFKKKVQMQGGITLECPTGHCTVRPLNSERDNPGSLKLEGMDLDIDGTSVGVSISDLLRRVTVLEAKAGIRL